jgi:hypothetical protein
MIFEELLSSKTTINLKKVSLMFSWLAGKILALMVHESNTLKAAVLKLEVATPLRFANFQKRVAKL